LSEPAARMVDVGAKNATAREATAECEIRMTPDACSTLVAGTPKGNPLEAAKVAGLLAAKRTPELLPYCHPVALTGGAVVIEPNTETGAIRVEATITATDRTGVEMEALTAAAVAALSLYDTAKAYDRSAEITRLRLLSKSGGKSGRYRSTR
jgi:cyclic pyranopterin phosphate synthase